MTNDRLRIEVKVGLDKVDSSAYPELYNEQIDIFLDDAIDEYVSEARKAFELNQQITDDVKNLVVTEVATVDAPINGVYRVRLPSTYLYLLRVGVKVSKNNSVFRSKASYRQQDDIETVLHDPFNKPVPHNVPYTMDAEGLKFYTNGDFAIYEITITFMRKPAVIAEGKEIDLNPKVHKTIVKRAVAIALENIESIRSRKQ
jgi:hypothetical protein